MDSDYENGLEIITKQMADHLNVQRVPGEKDQGTFTNEEIAREELVARAMMDDYLTSPEMMDCEPELTGIYDGERPLFDKSHKHSRQGANLFARMGRSALAVLIGSALALGSIAYKASEAYAGGEYEKPSYSQLKADGWRIAKKSITKDLPGLRGVALTTIRWDKYGTDKAIYTSAFPGDKIMGWSYGTKYKIDKKDHYEDHNYNGIADSKEKATGYKRIPIDWKAFGIRPLPSTSGWKYVGKKGPYDMFKEIPGKDSTLFGYHKNGKQLEIIKFPNGKVFGYAITTIGKKVTKHYFDGEFNGDFEQQTSNPKIKFLKYGY